MTEQCITLQYALNPTKGQIDSLKSHVGAVRYAYNYALEKVLSNWKAVKEDPTIEYINATAYSFRKMFNEEKETIAPWWNQNSKEAYNTGFANLQIALKNFYSKIAGLPKYKSRNNDENIGITFTTGTRRLEETRKHFTIPKIGTIRLYERASKLSYLLRHGGRITNVNVRFQRNKWFLNVLVRVNEELFNQYHLLRTKKDKKRVVGVDLGIKHAAVFSDGTVIENPRAFEKSLKKLRKLNKELSRRRKFDKKTGELASNRYERTRGRLRKQYARVTNIEVDFAHKLSKHLVDEFETIGLEDLNVAGMVKNRRLSRHISHASFGRLREFVSYKSGLYGSRVVLVDRFYPSSKSCSGCGVVRAKLFLSERVFECENLDCGLRIDRDLNAALNIEKIAAQSCGEAINGHGVESAGCLGTNSETIDNEVTSAITAQPNLGTLYK